MKNNQYVKYNNATSIQAASEVKKFTGNTSGMFKEGFDVPLYIPVSADSEKNTDGFNKIRILPLFTDDSLDEKRHYRFTYKAYCYFINNMSYLSYDALDSSLTSRNPMFSACLKYYKINHEKGRRFAGSERYFLYLIDLNDDNKLKVYPASKQFVTDIISCEEIKSNEEERFDVAGAEDGRVITFKRTGSGITTKYAGFSISSKRTIIHDFDISKHKPFTEVLKPCSIDLLYQRRNEILSEIGEPIPNDGISTNVNNTNNNNNSVDLDLDSDSVPL